MLSPQLSAFAAVLREGSFEAAARALHVTPSAISQRIKALEDQWGQVLLLRRSPCTATAAGQHLLRSVQQMQLLETETRAALGGHDAAAGLPGADRLAIAINADSLASWALPPLARLHVQYGHLFDIRVEDQDHSADLLRDGTVMGAITADARAVQGCTVESLGVMRYLPVATPDFVARHFPHGIDEVSLGRAPHLMFGRKDALQQRFIQHVTRSTLTPPVHYLPSSSEFVQATVLGLGWSMEPAPMVEEHLACGRLVLLHPASALDVPLYWQHWAIRSRTLDQLTQALRQAAAEALPH